MNGKINEGLGQGCHNKKLKKDWGVVEGIKREIIKFRI